MTVGLHGERMNFRTFDLLRQIALQIQCQN